MGFELSYTCWVRSGAAVEDPDHMVSLAPTFECGVESDGAGSYDEDRDACERMAERLFSFVGSKRRLCFCGDCHVRCWTRSGTSDCECMKLMELHSTAVNFTGPGYRECMFSIHDFKITRKVVIYIRPLISDSYSILGDGSRDDSRCLPSSCYAMLFTAYCHATVMGVKSLSPMPVDPLNGALHAQGRSWQG